MIIKATLLITFLLCSSTCVFSQTFRSVLGRNNVNAIVREITNRAVRGKRIDVDASYLTEAAALVGRVEANIADPSSAARELRELYGRFANHIVEFVQNQPRIGRATLTRETLKVYMSSNRRCGEAPCNMNCDPCNRKCNRCKL